MTLPSSVIVCYTGESKALRSPIDYDKLYLRYTIWKNQHTQIQLHSPSIIGSGYGEWVRKMSTAISTVCAVWVGVCVSTCQILKRGNPKFWEWEFKEHRVRTHFLVRGTPIGLPQACRQGTLMCMLKDRTLGWKDFGALRSVGMSGLQNSPNSSTGVWCSRRLVDKSLNRATHVSNTKRHLQWTK